MPEIRRYRDEPRRRKMLIMVTHLLGPIGSTASLETFNRPGPFPRQV